MLPAVPVLALWAGNAELIRSLYPLRISLGVVGTAVASALIVSVVQRDFRRSALVATVAVVAGVSIGHVLPDPRRAALNLGVLTVIVLFGVFLATHLSARGMSRLTLFLNVIAVALVVSNAGVVVLNRPPAFAVPANAKDSSGDDTAQSIWYLVPDRYPTESALRDLGFQSSDFFTALEGRGFQIIDEARANYPLTMLSLASAWSLSYLDETRASDLAYATGMLSDPAIGQVLTGAGYDYTHLGSWPEFTSTSESADQVLTLQGTNEFWTAWEQTTLLPTIRFLLDAREFSAMSHVRQVEHGRHQIRMLKDLAAREPAGPEFILAHLVLPHGPYVFNADGSLRDPARVTDAHARDGYAQQLAFLNDQLLDLVDTLQGRQDPPMIIIMSDEGLYPESLTTQMDEGLKDPALYTDDELRLKFSILAAVHDPSGRLPELDRASSAVNVVRAAVDSALGTTIRPPLPDITYRWADAEGSTLIPVAEAVLHPSTTGGDSSQ